MQIPHLPRDIAIHMTKEGWDGGCVIRRKQQMRVIREVDEPV